MPPARPLQVQLKVPLGFVGLVLTPALHAAEPVGADATFVLFAEPQRPGVAAIATEHWPDVLPPLIPAQVQVKLEVPVVTVLAVPGAHRLVVGVVDCGPALIIDPH